MVQGPPGVCRAPYRSPSNSVAFTLQGTVYPAGYTPARPAPMDDFRSKFLGVRVVNDIGSRQERSFTFTQKQVLRRIDLQAGILCTSFATPPPHPLSAGEHTTTAFMRLSAEHCDGLGTNPEENCLPAASSCTRAHPSRSSPATPAERPDVPVHARR